VPPQFPAGTGVHEGLQPAVRWRAEHDHRPERVAADAAPRRDNERVTDRWPPDRYVVVSGPPASGKTTLASALAPALGLPLIAKDTIKQALMTVLPVPDVPASRMIGRTSVAALLAVAAEAPGAVLESVWHRSHAAAELGNLPGNLVEVFCRCDPAIAAERYARRAGTRAAGHFDAKRTIEELWNDDVARPVAGGWPVLEVDTTARVDITLLVERIQAAVAVPRAVRSRPRPFTPGSHP
jgi:predicted kinase